MSGFREYDESGWIGRRAPAKVNLFLEVGPRRDDGYHPVSSLMEPVTLFDTVRARRRPAGGAVIAGMSLPPEENTVMKAVRALEQAAGVVFDIEFEIDKEIPMAAGLGGGSSDAAASLRLLVSMYSLNIKEEELAAVALRVGADVPFFLRTGPQLAAGAGEILESVEAVPPHSLVLVRPACGLAAGAVYRELDRMRGAGTARENSSGAGAGDRRRQAALSMSSFEDLLKLLGNDLEAPAISLCPDIGAVRRELAAAGAAGVLLSGSGSTVFGLFAGQDAARSAAESLLPTAHNVWVVNPLDPA